jgi:UDPglucose--hexose-1-phosphate uridylyltransferase
MAEIRQDPLTGRAVLLSPGRANRPDQFAAIRAVPGHSLTDDSGTNIGEVSDDPFAPGHEDQTPPEVLAVRPDGSPPDTPGWMLRVVPNSYPAVDPVGPAKGRHEVFVETNDGTIDLADAPLSQFVRVVTAWRDRLRDCERDQTLEWGLVFKNSGAAAGASIVHAHSQLLALTVVPDDVRRLLQAERDHLLARGECATCATLVLEQSVGSRIVLADTDHVLYCPWASRFPFEMRIAPVRHAARFTRMDDARCVALADMLREALRRLLRVAPGSSYNLVVRTAPLPEAECDAASHWWIEVLPRIGQLAGFELASGMFLNTFDPDDAASRLRAATASSDVRLLDEGELSQLIDLFRDTVRTVNIRDYTASQVVAWAPDVIHPAEWRTRFADQRVFVFECDGEPTGFASYEADGHLDMFYVHARRQRRGIGATLLNALEADANSRGLSRIYGEISVTARPFFESRGYVHLAEQTVRVRGVTFTNHRMEKRW